MATHNQVHYHERTDEPASSNSVWAIALVVLAVIALLIWGYGYSGRQQDTGTTNNNTINTPGDAGGGTNLPPGTGAGTTP